MINCKIALENQLFVNPIISLVNSIKVRDKENPALTHEDKCRRATRIIKTTVTGKEN